MQCITTNSYFLQDESYDDFYDTAACADEYEYRHHEDVMCNPDGHSAFDIAIATHHVLSDGEDFPYENWNENQEVSFTFSIL
jgi:hypothetical protein